MCNRHLSYIADSLDLITEKGATVLTISPEKPEYLEKMIEKTQAKFALLFDSGYQIAAQYDVNFVPEKATATMYNVSLGANFKSSHKTDEVQAYTRYFYC